MKSSVKEIIRMTAVVALLTAVSGGCQSGQVSYNTASPPPIRISAARQPVYVVFRDSRTTKPSAPVFASAQDRRGALNPEVLQEKVYEDPAATMKKLTIKRLKQNGIAVTDTENNNTIIADLQKYEIVYDKASNLWKANIVMSVSSDLHSQGIHTTFQKANISGNKDGFDVLSTAVSLSIDRISWERHFPD